MHKKYWKIIVFVVFLSIISGCSLIRQPNDNSLINDKNELQVKPPKDIDKGETSEDEKNDEAIKPSDTIADQISKMTLEEKIGQMLIVGVEAYNFNDNTKSLVQKYKVGGIIALGENVKNTKQLLNLLNSIRKENQKNNIPLFMSIDEEGGRISRVPKEFKKLPTNKAIGQINDNDFSYKIGRILADEIRAFGFNMDFAPVLDVNSNPKNPVIGDRSFSSDADTVSNLGVQTMKGIRSRSVIPVVKHFPGHGDTSVDSHLGLPSVNNDLKRLKDVELIPFVEAIKNNVEAVMIAHILLPKIDKENPSSMSKTIITDILRTDLNYDGVVITDDMTMGAIMKNYDIGEAAVKSVNAGTDIVLVCHGFDKEVEVINALKDAVSKGDIQEKRIDESVYRILKLKKKYNLKDKIINSVDVNVINNEINAVLKEGNS